MSLGTVFLTATDDINVDRCFLHSDVVSSAVLSLLAERATLSASPTRQLLAVIRSAHGWEAGLSCFVQRVQGVKNAIDCGQFPPARLATAATFADDFIDISRMEVTVRDGKHNTQCQENDATKLAAAEQAVAMLTRVVLFVLAYARILDEHESSMACTHIQARQRGNVMRQVCHDGSKTHMLTVLGAFNPCSRVLRSLFVWPLSSKRGVLPRCESRHSSVVAMGACWQLTRNGARFIWKAWI